jgi:hypothetical protein
MGRNKNKNKQQTQNVVNTQQPIPNNNTQLSETSLPANIMNNNVIQTNMKCQ